MADETPQQPPKGSVPETDSMVREGGPTLTQAGAYPGGSEMEGWKRPTGNKTDPNEGTTLEEQAENVRERAES